MHGKVLTAQAFSQLSTLKGNLERVRQTGHLEYRDATRYALLYNPCPNLGPMSDNVIKFQRPKKPKPPRQVPPWLRKLIVAGVIILAFAAAYGYFALTGQGTRAGL
jgi:hypothetical protein